MRITAKAHRTQEIAVQIALFVVFALILVGFIGFVGHHFVVGFRKGLNPVRRPWGVHWPED